MMKKIFAGILSIFAVLGLVACSEETPTLKSLSISGQDTEFTVGDTFDDGDLKVVAKMSDDTEIDVTDKVTVTQSADMTKAGTYAVLVSYEGFTTAYQITVVAEEVVTVESIAITGQKTVFTVGDTFDKGELKVTATLSDGTTEDVTAAAKVEQNADMTKAGSYAVLVSYDGFVAAYQIAVNAPENVETLKAVNVDVNTAKTQYVLGEEVSVEGVTVVETYSNTTTVDTYKYGNLADYTVKVTDENGEEVTGALNKLGIYTVTVSKGELSDSYAVEVEVEVYESINEALEAGLANADKIVSGNIAVEQYGYINETTYEFGKDFTLVKSPYASTYYQLTEDGTPFGVQESYGELSAAYGVTELNLLGADLGGILGYAYEVFGLESLLETLVTVSADEEYSYNYAESFKEYCNVCGMHNVYNYSFETLMNDYYYYYIDVNFTLDGATNSIAEVEVVMNGYYKDNMNYDEENNVYTVKEEVSGYDFETFVTATQVAGERTAENPYPVDDLLYTAFDLTDAENNAITEGQELVAVVKNGLTINIINAAPETANPNIDSIDVEVLDSEGQPTYSVYGGYDSLSNTITITAYKVGTYTVNVTTTNVTKSFVMKVDYAELTSLNAGVYNEMYNELEEKEEVTVYTGATVTFGAIVNDSANPEVTVALKEANDNVTLDFDGENHTFVATVAGTYEVVLTSTVDATKTATLKVVVEEAPSIADLLKGKYTYSSSMMGTANYEFIPESEGALTGKLTISNEGGYINTGSGKFTYTYYEALSYLEVVPLEGSENYGFSVELDTNTMTLQCIYNYYPQGPLQAVSSSEVVEGALEGTYSATYTHPRLGDQVWTLTFNTNGTGSYNFNNYYNTGTFKYAVDGSALTITEIVDDMGDTIEITSIMAGGTIYATINFVNVGQQASLEFTGESSNTETTDTPVVGTNNLTASYYGTTHTFTAEEAGTYTFDADSSVVYGIAFGAYDYPELPKEVTLQAGESIEFTVISQEDNGEIVVEVTITKA